MTGVSVNYLAILVAAIVNMVLGALWYGPLFGKTWTQLCGFTSEKMDEMKKKGMTKSYVLMFAGSLIMAYVLNYFVVYASSYTNASGAYAGLMVGVWAWLGFVAPTTVGMVLWEGKPWKYWYIVSGYYLVALAIMGKILAIWM
jgi:hypothetical protein